MDIFGKEEGTYPDRSKRWFKSSVAFGDIVANEVSIPVPSHSIIHGVKVKPTVQWDQGDIEVTVNNAPDSLLSSYVIGSLTPASDEYRVSTCLSAVPHTGSPEVTLDFTGTVGSLTQGELDIWLNLSRTL